ncbi:MAG TPA: DUF969 family protein [Acidobacteriota bacterium]|nr:DUF969 family protein [Acidobacteriota bacterium]HNG94172.1 DUF969 family protein [Acidobacteriota bacterium]
MIPELKLLGILIIIIGLIFRLKTGPVILVAGIATGLLAGMPLIGTETTPGIFDTLGKAFLDGRLISLYLITLPAIGLAERYGLHQAASKLIQKLRLTTVGSLLWIYQFIRVLIGASGLRVSGHAVFGRPLILPMAFGIVPPAEYVEEQSEQIKGNLGASENYGNFFGQNLFPASAGCLLVYKVLKDAGLETTPIAIAIDAIPIVVCSLLLSVIQFLHLKHSNR